MRKNPGPAMASRRTRLLAEFSGTYLLVLVGPGTAIALSYAKGLSALESLTIIALSFGTVVGVVISLFGKISGAHIDPAITVAHAVYGKNSRDMITPYVSVQILGAVLAGLTLRLIFGSSTYIGSTKLASGLSVPAGILFEAIGTFVLACSGFIASRKIHNRGGEAVFIGTVLFLIILVLAPLTNASVNPARSLGPALASWYLTNLYVYMLGPTIGGLAAGLVFRYADGKQIEEEFLSQRSEIAQTIIAD
ncbi:MAG TPA: aquaporin [Candidatus Bathyarchaeia archaeon]|nr:aquaporin [Candidatus Bathyarchaeia archaeon]